MKPKSSKYGPLTPYVITLKFDVIGSEIEEFIKGLSSYKKHKFVYWIEEKRQINE